MYTWNVLYVTGDIFSVTKSDEARETKLAIVGSVFFYQSVGILSFFFFLKMLVNLISDVANNSFSVKYIREKILGCIIKFMAGLGPRFLIK